ncbi:Fatty-acid and retinol-binding protein 3 [Aphelenchoides fujianensis]|nr:Fatty-acid and retinol-binding protein 3 [Aphelenchoides fujianensis]
MSSVALLAFTLFSLLVLADGRGQTIQVPDELAGLLPTDLLEFYNGLTPKQERIMDTAMNGNEGNEEGFLDFISRNDAELGQKAESVFKGFIEHLAALKMEAQQFYLTLFNGLLRQFNAETSERELKGFTADVLLQWVALKRSARRSLAVHFPSVAHALNSRTVREYAGFSF